MSRELGLRLIEQVLGHEGGYVNHPLDKGGETIWGVTEATARQYGYRGDMKSMKREQAIEIYMQLFWLDRFDRIAFMPKLAYALLDFGVNSGTGRPAEALQRSLNVLNLNGKRWKDLDVDGAIGGKTVAAASLCKTALPDAEELLCFAVNSLRVAFIINFAERSPAQEAFMLGWLRRYKAVANG